MSHQSRVVERTIRALVTISTLMTSLYISPSSTTARATAPRATLLSSHPSSDLSDYAVLGLNSVWLRQGSILHSGHVGAQNASPDPVLNSGAEVTIGQKVTFYDPASVVAGDTIKLKTKASVFDLYYNELDVASNATHGELFTPLSLPLVSSLPPFPEINPGSTDYTLDQGDTLELPAGAYGEIRLKNSAVLTLTGGVYHLANLSLGTKSQLRITAPTEVRIAERLEPGQKVTIGPAEGSGLDAADLHVFVGGINGKTGKLGGSPKAAVIGQKNVVTATIYAPNGTLWLKQNTRARGAFIAKDVHVGQKVEVWLESEPSGGEGPLNQPPVVIITAPTEGTVVAGGDVEMMGTVSDSDGTVVSVLVNDVPATLADNTFSVVVPVESGNQVINAVAEDDLGAFGFDSVVVRVEGDGPMIAIHTPADHQAVYTLQPTVAISYTDFYSAVNVGSLSVVLTDQYGVTTDVTGGLTATGGEAWGTVSTPLAEDTSYTMTVSLADAYSNVQQASVVFYVPPAPASIVPPEESGGAGWVSGVVYDSSTCNEHLTTCEGLAGARVTLSHAGDLGDVIEGTIVTGPGGFFAFPVGETDHFWVRVEKNGYTYSQRAATVVREHSTATNEIYLTPIDPAVSYCDDSGCSHSSSDGVLEIEIPPGAIASGEEVEVTATHFEHVEFLPSGELPPGTWETYAFNLGGDSEVTFTQPITVLIQNYRGFSPATKIPLGYWNQETLEWEHAGTGVVDASGAWVVMAVTHFSNYDCNDPIARPSLSFYVEDMTGGGGGNPCPEDEPGCSISLKSGTLKEDYTLPSVASAGQSTAPKLLYSSNRADPSAVIDIGFSLEFGGDIEMEDYIGFELYIEGEKTDNFAFSGVWQDNEVRRYRYLWDGKNAQGDMLPPGVYEYAVRLSILYRAEYCYALNGQFGGPPDCVNGSTGIFADVVQSIWTVGTVELDAQVGGPLGTGWALDGVQRLYEDEAGRILIADGRRNDEFYFPAKDLVQSAPAGESVLAWTTERDTLQILPEESAHEWPGGPIPVGDSPGGLAISPDSAFAYVTNALDGTLSVISLADLEEVEIILLGGNPGDIAVTPDGSLAYIVNGAKHGLSVVDLSTFQVSTIPLGTPYVDRIALSPTEPYAYVTRSGGATEVCVVNLVTGVWESTIELGSYVRPVDIAVSPDGSFAYVTTTAAGLGLAKVDLDTLQVVQIYAIGAKSIVLSPDGSHAYVTRSSYDDILVIDLDLEQQVAAVEVGKQPYGIALSPDGVLAYVTSLQSDSVSVVDLSLEQDVETINVGDYPIQVAVSSDGAFLCTANLQDDSVTVVPLPALGEIVQIDGIAVRGEIDVALSSDGTLAYVVGEDWTEPGMASGVLLVADVQTGQLVDQIPVIERPNRIALSSDDTYAYLATANTEGGGENGLVVVNLVTRQVEAFVQLGSRPCGVALSPDDAYAYVTQGWNLSVIDLDEEQQVASIPMGGGYYCDIAISPDGALAYAVDLSASIVARVDLQEHDVSTIPLTGRAQGIALSPGGDYAYFPIGYDSILDSGAVGVVNLGIGGQIDSIALSGIPRDIVLSSDGLTAYVPSSAGISAVDLIAGEEISTLPVSGVSAIAVSEGKVTPTLYSRTATDHSSLRYDLATDTYTRIYPNGVQVRFNPDGTHDYTLEPDGREMVYAYNPDGTVATMGVVLPGEITPRWVWTFGYDADGKLETITDPAGRVTALAIDEHDHLTAISAPDGSSRRYAYDERGLMTQAIDENGAVTSFGYDEYGRLSTHTGPQRTVYDPETGQTETMAEVKTFTPSDTAYPLINESPVGDPDNPAPPVPTSADLVDGVTYGRGGRSGHTNKWGNWLDETDGLGRTVTYEQDEANNVTKITLPGGDCMEVDYDANGRATSITRIPADQCILAPEDRDPSQQQTFQRTLETRFGKPKTVTDAAGRTVTYTYDYELDMGEAGNLVRTESPAVEDENGVLVTPVMSRTYDSLGLLETETDVRGAVTRYVRTQGTLDEVYGQPGALFAEGVTPVPGLITQVIEDDGGYGYTTTYRDFDALGNPQTTIYRDGRIKTRAFDEMGRVVAETDPAGLVTVYEYDDGGRTVRVVVDYTEDGTTGANIVMTYAYDGDGRTLHERTEAGNLVVETYYRYDANGRVVAEIDGEGHEIRTVYDDAGQVVETIDPAGHSTFYTYNDDGLPETVTDAEGHVTRTVYDEHGRVKQTIQAEGELDLTTTYAYTHEGLPIEVEAPSGLVTCFEYDALGRRTKTIQDCGPGGLNLTTTYAYNVAGDLVYTTAPRGIVTVTEYDALGRVTLTRQDDGGLNLETVTTYDDRGNVDTVTGPDGTVTEYEYDSLNRLVAVCQDATGLNVCTSYGYDRLGRQSVITDAEGVVHRTVYNDFGLPVQEIADADGLAATTHYEYDDLLDLVRVIDANGNPTEYTYTARGEIESELYADGTSVSYAYDPRGNVDMLTLEDGAVIDYTYDAAGRRTRADFSTGGFQTFDFDDAGRMTQAAQTMDGHTTVTGYDYDVLGGVIATTQQLDSGTVWQVGYEHDYVPSQRTVTYPSGVERTYTSDALYRLDTVETGDGTVIADYGYDVINRINTVAYNNGMANRVAYDPRGRITQVAVNDGSGDIVDYRYGYDDVGNRTHVQRMHRAGQPYEVYEYDGLYQLVNAWYGADASDPATITTYDSVQGYDLDDMGNRLTVTEDGVDENYGPNDGQQLTNVLNQYESVDGEALSYDLRGNTLSDGVNGYTYDILNRQTSVTNGGGTTEYVYDARGRRVAKIAGGVTTHYIYDTQYRVIEERADDGTLQARYTYGAGMDEPLTMERGGEIYTYHRDALGSVTEVTDSSGAIVERYEYDVYGKARTYDGSFNPRTTSTIDNPYLFTGRRYDPESGNYYYRARMYSPWLGRFLSQDPLGFDAGDYNLYRYVLNNPTNLTDPTGELPVIIAMLLQATTEAAADAVMQAAFNWLFSPCVNSAEEALRSIDLRRVGWAFLTGLVPGGRWVKSAVAAWGDVYFFLLDAEKLCLEVTAEEVLRQFAWSFFAEIAGDYLGELVAKYGTRAIAKGLKKLGFDEWAEKLLRRADGRANVPYHPQESPETCGPACVRMAYESLAGSPVSEREIVRLAGDLFDEGTSFGDIPSIASRLGLSGELGQGMGIPDIEAALRSGKAVVVDLDAGFLDRGRVSYAFGHGVVVTDVRGGRVYFHDPDLSLGGGPGRSLTIEDFLTAWDARFSRMVTLTK